MHLNAVDWIPIVLTVLALLSGFVLWFSKMMSNIARLDHTLHSVETAVNTLNKLLDAMDQRQRENENRITRLEEQNVTIFKNLADISREVKEK